MVFDEGCPIFFFFFFPVFGKFSEGVNVFVDGGKVKVDL